MQQTEPRVLADFSGAWKVIREITPTSGPTARFRGSALWRTKGRGLAYLEKGILSITGQTPMQAERRYFWAEDLSVYFDDGRFFHRVPAAGGATSHWCDPDSYRVTYDFDHWPHFRVIWDVKGPNKDYRSESDYTRC